MRTGLCAGLIVLLAGCGFQFAGGRPLPSALSPVYVDMRTPYTVRRPPIVAALNGLISRRGGTVSDSAGAARTTLRLSGLDESRVVLSVGPDSKAVEFRLTAAVDWQLLHDGKPLLEPDRMAVSRDYSFTARQVLSKEAEEDRLRAFIQQELAELLMLRIESQLRALQPDEPETPVGVVPVREPVP